MFIATMMLFFAITGFVRYFDDVHYAIAVPCAFVDADTQDAECKTIMMFTLLIRL